VIIAIDMICFARMQQSLVLAESRQAK